MSSRGSAERFETPSASRAASSSVTWRYMAQRPSPRLVVDVSQGRVHRIYAPFAAAVDHQVRAADQSSAAQRPPARWVAYFRIDAYARRHSSRRPWSRRSGSERRLKGEGGPLGARCGATNCLQEVVTKPPELRMARRCRPFTASPSLRRTRRASPLDLQLKTRTEVCPFLILVWSSQVP